MSNPFETAVKKTEAEEKRAREHTITIYVRGCDTTRDCYCLNTNGYSHTEYESPWIVDMEGHFERGQGKEQPLEYPFRPGEDLEEYNFRMARREAWQEGYEFWYENDRPPEHMDYGKGNPYE